MASTFKPDAVSLRAHLQKGFTIIELMVALAIGLIVTLAVMGMMVVSQTHERVTTSSNDMSQGGAFTASILDNSLRSAGAGFSQYWNLGAMGCRINAKRDGVQILPRTAALPTPFANVMGGSAGITDLRLAPLLIGQGQSQGGSDVLIAMAGLHNVGDVPRNVATYSGGQLYLTNTVSIHQNDVVLVSRDGTKDCIMTQVDGGAKTPFADVAGQTFLPLGGALFSDQSADGTVSLGTLTLNSGGKAILSGIGSVDSVRMQVFGVGSDSTLYSYDLLQSTGKDASEALMEGVVAMRATYSVNSNADDITKSPAPTWQAPTGNYALDALIAQTPPTRMRSIVAVRVSLLLRSTVRQNQMVASDSYTLLDGVAGSTTVSISDANRYYTHRVVETTIPLRSMMMRLLPAEEVQLSTSS
ncbi:prepilin-type N-terminal cleavage/methylation domain-containing protein [Diaphorobacter sp. HDW4A]|uniref:PilW family protein n=1 Tax=Diaphorobacter sp. HDW4A TaxID=2714924 RepID=UPI00140AAB05|nr:PilW family protein [Diaphorobacter sp. HDW4A]QIL83613.1 prepilin-type N-terminal cleavage/methylation domain-containing protein [Diaphorobacter sp. HDW4A]